jgi:hypothetical protein
MRGSMEICPRTAAEQAMKLQEVLLRAKSDKIALSPAARAPRVRGGHREYDGVTLCWKLSAARIPGVRFPCLEGTTGSISLGIFDESEGSGSKESQDRSRVQTARRPWPLSARLLVGAMFVSNILLVAFIFRTEIKWPGAPATSTPLPLEPPKAGPSPQLNAPVDKEPSLDPNASPIQFMPAPLPSTQMAKRPAVKAQRASRTLLPDLSAPVPRVHPPKERPGQTPVLVRVPAASPGSSANVAPPGRAASFGAPGAGVLGNAEPHPKAPAASVLAPPAMGQGPTAKATRPASTNRVASVGLPSIEKGSVMPKRPVASISPKIEIVPRTAGELENCGSDEAFIACPTLQTRPERPISSEGP